MNPSIDTTVNLIDDDPVALNALRRIIHPIGWRTESFHSADAFLESHGADRPGCLVADLSMPGMNGIEILCELNDRENPLPALFVTSRANVSDAVSLMQSGAVTLLEKPCRDRTLIEAIHSAVRLDSERRMVAARRRELEQRLSRLSRDERHVLKDLVAGKTNKRIAFDHGIALRTAEYRRRNIFSKFEVQSIAELAASVAEIQRLADISALLNAPPIRLTDSRSASFCMPMWLRTVGRNRPAIDPPCSILRNNHIRQSPVRDAVPT